MYVSEIFKTLGDETRLRILNLLSRHELCVCMIEEVLKLSQPNASKHFEQASLYGDNMLQKDSTMVLFQCKLGV